MALYYFGVNVMDDSSDTQLVSNSDTSSNQATTDQSSDGNITTSGNSQVIIGNLTFDNIIAERRLRMDEARLRLEQRKAVHDMNMEKQREDFSESEQLAQDKLANEADSHWLKTFWRPIAAWTYLLICACDFIIFPIGWNILQVYNHQTPITSWTPLTLQGGGLIHVAFGAIIGVSSWTRTQEKLAIFNNSGTTTPTTPPASS